MDMQDPGMREWRKPLQDARGLYKKIQTLPPGEEKERLILEHKKLLDKARENLNEYNKPSSVKD